jgi:ribosomal protein S18 acetylase RimI-like enzyme
MIVLRLAEAGDCGSLVALCAAFHAQHARLCPNDYRPQLDRAELAGMIMEASRHEIIPVAAIGGAVVGYAWCGVVDRPASALSPPAKLLFLQQLFVAPLARRQGVAAKLLSSVRDIAATIGAERVVLDCSVSNGGALAFFESQGFRPSTVIMQSPPAHSARDADKGGPCQA